MKFYLETERLILRELLETDLEGMFELDSNATVHKYLGNNPITTREQAAENIRYIREQYDKLGIGRFAAIEKSSGDFIGWSGLKLNVGEKEKPFDFEQLLEFGAFKIEHDQRIDTERGGGSGRGGSIYWRIPSMPMKSSLHLSITRRPKSSLLGR